MRLVDSALGHFSSQPEVLAHRDRLLERQATQRDKEEKVRQMLAKVKERAARLGGSILDFQTEVRVLERSAQRDLETNWRPSSGGG